jgi:serine phosphatase RsbU (regulator of sigma subunit)
MSKGPRQLAQIRFLLLVFILSIIVLEFPGARDLIRPPYPGIQTLNLAVQNVAPEGPNAGDAIQRDDEILAVDGVRVRNFNHLRYLVSLNTEFRPQEYTLRRGDDIVTETVSYVSLPAWIIYRRFAFLLVGFTFLLVALLVLVRRGDQIGTLFAVNCAILAFFLTDRPIFAMGWLQLAGELLEDALILMFPAVFLHFFLVFHDRPHRLSRRRQIRRAVVLYSLPSLVYAVSCFFAVSQFFGAPTNQTVLTLILTVSTLYMTVFLVASLIIFIRNYRASSIALRQKLRIAILGTIVGILPFLGMIVWRQISTVPHTIWELLSVIALAFVSISFGYAILKHGVIEVNIVIRKGLVYAVLTGAIITAYYMLVNLVGDYLTNEFSLRPAYLSVLTILVLAVIFAPARDAVQRVADRVFFRGGYDYAQEVVEFNRQLSKKLKRTEILEYFSGRMNNLLKASFVAFYTPAGEEQEWIIEEVTGDGSALPTVFPPDSLLGRYLTRYKKPLMVEYLDRLWGRRHLDERSTNFLTSSGASVCLPIGGADSFFGLVVMGPKRSGQLYNQTDSHLLERMAEHLGLVLENADFHEATFEQERLKNEVLVAREIQLGLLPKAPPEHTGLKILGQMASSVEVGGDYFDYFSLDSHRVGVGIGDGSGKGVPAAMLMSSLQAVFKNLALKDKMSPTDLVGELNRHLCEAAKADQFATFFYGILDLDDSTFTFSNAGHCPVLLYKKEYVDRLGEGGMPLGVESAQVYQEGRIRIDSGDMLFFYTDGVTEQHNSDGELFGEERLISLLQANKNLSLSELQELLFAAVRNFGGGRQEDDVTTIIARYSGA